jgi:hypothetical protein
LYGIRAAAARLSPGLAAAAAEMPLFITIGNVLLDKQNDLSYHARVLRHIIIETLPL